MRLSQSWYLIINLTREKISKEIVSEIQKYNIISLISDAGTPVISDPGKILIEECVSKNIPIIPIPGVSSVTATASISGFSVWKTISIKKRAWDVK